MNQYIKKLILEAFDFNGYLNRYLNNQGEDLPDEILKTNAPIIYAFTTPKVPDAIKKAIGEAKKNLIEVPIVNTTVPHECIGKFGSANVLLKPAEVGTGLIAGGSVRPVLELAGYQNIRTKVIGTNNPRNVVYATIEGLKSMQTVEQVAAKRGKKVSEIL